MGDLSRQDTIPYDSAELFEQFREEQAEVAREALQPNRLVRRRTNMNLEHAITVSDGLGSRSSLFGGTPFSSVLALPRAPSGAAPGTLVTPVASMGPDSSV